MIYRAAVRLLVVVGACWSLRLDRGLYTNEGSPTEGKRAIHDLVGANVVHDSDNDHDEDSDHECRTVQVTKQPKFVPLPTLSDGVIILSCYVSIPRDLMDRVRLMKDPSKVAIKFYFGDDDEILAGKHYVIRLGLTKGILITKDYPNNAKPNVTFEDKPNFKLFKSAVDATNAVTSFYIKLKFRPDYFGILVAKATDSENPFLVMKETNRKPPRDFQLFGTQLTGLQEDDDDELVDDKPSKLTLHYDCDVRLMGICSHDVDCAIEGSVCLPTTSTNDFEENDDEARCVCDSDFEERKNSYSGTMSCVRREMKIGDHCDHSRQCDGLEAKCRKFESTGGQHTKVVKRCSCFKNMLYDPARRKCTERPDGVTNTMDFQRLGSRIETLNEFRPEGRPVRPSGPIDLKHDRSKTMCVNADAAASVHLVEYFPIAWRKTTGFVMGLRVKGGNPKLQVLLTRNSQNFYGVKPVYDFTVDFKAQKLELVNHQYNLTVAKTVAAGQDPILLAEKTFLPYRLEMSCNRFSQDGLVHQNCSLTFGRRQHDRQPILETYLGDPMTSWEWQPSHVSFRSEGNRGMEVEFNCRVARGDGCVDDVECENMDPKLECRLNNSKEVDDNNVGGLFNRIFDVPPPPTRPKMETTCECKSGESGGGFCA